MIFQNLSGPVSISTIMEVSFGLDRGRSVSTNLLSGLMRSTALLLNKRIHCQIGHSNYRLLDITTFFSSINPMKAIQSANVSLPGWLKVTHHSLTIHSLVKWAHSTGVKSINLEISSIGTPTFGVMLFYAACKH